MIRTLTVVACCTLLGGLSMGFFVAQARSAADRRHPAASNDPVLERKVALYAENYGLTSEEAARVRSTLRKYDEELQDLLRRLRSRHQDEFRALGERADAQIREILGDRAR
jgi:hypothetical protein